MDVPLALNNIGTRKGLKGSHTANYLFGVKIPFTPGIIAKDKRRFLRPFGSVALYGLIMGIFYNI